MIITINFNSTHEIDSNVCGVSSKFIIRQLQLYFMMIIYYHFMQKKSKKKTTQDDLNKRHASGKTFIFMEIEGSMFLLK